MLVPGAVERVANTQAPRRREATLPRRAQLLFEVVAGQRVVAVVGEDSVPALLAQLERVAAALQAAVEHQAGASRGVTGVPFHFHREAIGPLSGSADHQTVKRAVVVV